MRRLSQDLIPAGTEDLSPNQLCIAVCRGADAPTRSQGELFLMYEILVATAFAATVFFPSFIGIRAQTAAQEATTRRRSR